MARLRVVCCLVLGYSVIAIFAAFNKEFSGPFDVMVKQFADCVHPERYPAKWTGNKIRKINRTSFKYSTDVYFPDEFDDNIKLTVVADIFGNGGWRENYFVLPVGGVCTAFTTYVPGVQKALEKVMGTCPIPAGNYTVKDLVLDITIVWPSFVYSSYRFNLYMKRMDKDYLCKRVFLDFVPKAKN